MLRQILARFYPYEIHLLVGWSALAIAQKFTDWPLDIIVAVFALDLIFFYLLFHLIIIINDEDGWAVRAFPNIYGVSLALVVIGVTLTLLNGATNIFTSIGLGGVLLTCLMLFIQTVQDKYLPILKVFLIRTLVILILGFIFSF